MEPHTPKFKFRLGLFIIAGLALFFVAIFLIGKQKNMFDPIFNIKTTFNNVSGLMVGSNVRFSGINVGTVDDISIINDSTVLVTMILRKNVMKFIKEDSKATIGSAGIIGDKVMMISQGSASGSLITDGGQIESVEPIELDAIMQSIEITAYNAEDISLQLAQIMGEINSGKGTLGRLLKDTTIAENINQTIVNLKASSKGLDENMNAAKENFLLRGYFKRKDRKAAEQKEAAQEKIEEQQKLQEEIK